jgi:hypothetical protein
MGVLAGGERATLQAVVHQEDQNTSTRIIASAAAVIFLDQHSIHHDE